MLSWPNLSPTLPCPTALHKDRLYFPTTLGVRWVMWQTSAQRNMGTRCEPFSDPVEDSRPKRKAETLTGSSCVLNECLEYHLPHPTSLGLWCEKERNHWDFVTAIRTLHFSSVARLCLTLCESMDCSRPGFPVLIRTQHTLMNTSELSHLP